MTSVRAWLGTPSTARDITGLSVVVVLLYLLTGSHPAYGSSNRYSEACREMVELGQWTIPHLNYVPYFEKPILTYWLGAASQWLFGGGDLASNLPAGLAALVTVLATYGLGCRLRGAGFGVAAALFILTGGMFLAMTSVLTTDPILTACLAVVWLAFWRWDEERAACPAAIDRRWLWVFWVALGLGFLSKGPIAIVIAGAAIAGYALLCGGLRGVFTLLWAMCPLRGVAVLLAINLPWSLAVWMRDPRFLEFFYIRINFQAFFDGEINHPGPWWYYAPIVASYLWPYALIAVPALAIGCWRALAPVVAQLRSWSAVWGTTATAFTSEQRGRIFLTSVVLFPLLFLSVSASKLGTYPLPLLPAMAVLVMDVLWLGSPRANKWWSGLMVGQAVILLLALVIAPLVLMAIMYASGQPQPLSMHSFGFTWELSAKDDPGMRSFNWSALPVAVLALVAFTAGVLGSGLLAMRGRVLLALAALGLGFTCLVVVLMPRINQVVIDLDDSRLMAIVKQHGGHQDPVVVTKDVVHYYELVHTLGRRLHAYGATRELGMGFFAQVEPTADFPTSPYDVSGDNLPQHPWLYSDEGLRTAWNGAQRMWLVGHYGMAEEFRQLGLSAFQVERIRKTCLYTNQPLSPQPLSSQPLATAP